MLLRAACNLVQPSMRIRSRRPEKLRGYFGKIDLLNVGLRIHVEHGLFADLALEPAERLPFARMLLHEGFSRHPDRLIHRKIIVIVLEQSQTELLYFRIGRIHVDQIDGILIDRLEAQGMLHAIDLLRIECEMIVVDQPRVPVLSIHELVAECLPALPFYATKIAYPATDLPLLHL